MLMGFAKRGDVFRGGGRLVGKKEGSDTSHEKSQRAARDDHVDSATDFA